MNDRVWILEIYHVYTPVYLYFKTRDKAVRYAMRLVRAMGKTADEYSIGIFEDSLEDYFTREFEYNHYDILKA